MNPAGLPLAVSINPPCLTASPALLLHFECGAAVQKSVLLAAIQKEIQRHDFSYFVDDSAVSRAMRQRRRRFRLSGLQKADQHDNAISGSYGERRDAGPP